MKTPEQIKQFMYSFLEDNKIMENYERGLKDISVKVAIEDCVDRPSGLLYQMDWSKTEEKYFFWESYDDEYQKQLDNFLNEE